MSDEISPVSSPEAAIEKTALNMLRQKLDDILIKQVTGLSDEALARLKNKL